MDPVEISPGVFWVGSDKCPSLHHSNPYLIVHNDEGLLIDPGSTSAFQQVRDTIETIIPLKKLKYIVLQHQGAEVCASTPLFKEAGFSGSIITHWRTSLFKDNYTITSQFLLTNRKENRRLSLGGRELLFLHLPCSPFSTTVATYDRKGKILFSGDFFGAFAEEWSLFAGEKYVEQMLSFHESSMPGKGCLTSIMTLFQQYDIDIIAPQKGSVIRDETSQYITALKNLERGAPLRIGEETPGGSYRELVNRVLERLIAVFSSEKVQRACEETGLSFTSNCRLKDSQEVGFEECNRLFESFHAAGGSEWISLCEPLVLTLTQELSLKLPDIYETSFFQQTEEANHFEENSLLQQQYNELRKQLKHAEKKLATDPLTELYQESFFLDYLKSDIESNSLTDISYSFCIIEIDTIIDINKKYGIREGDETLNHATYLLRKFKKEDKSRAHHLLFKLSGPRFVYYCEDTTREELLTVSELIRQSFHRAEIFIEPVTVTIGLVHSDENAGISSEYSHEYIMEKMIETARIRVRIGLLNGGDTVVDQSDDEIIASGRPGIIIADSDISGASYLASILREKGLEVRIAGNGMEVIRMVIEKRPKVIISEVMLPRIDGFSLRNHLLRDSDMKDIPFVFLSYLKDDSSILRALSLEIQHYYVKPYNLTEITGIIQFLAFKNNHEF